MSLVVLAPVIDAMPRCPFDTTSTSSTGSWACHGEEALVAALAPGASDDDEACDGDAAPVVPPEDETEERGPRYPTGTWTIWRSQWFYITQTAGWVDVKIHMNGIYQNAIVGMGTVSRSRTLTPWHYGDGLDDPWRTLILLKAWALWRARWDGWANRREGRVREADKLSRGIIADLRRAHGGVAKEPLLGSRKAHRFLHLWVPHEVAVASEPE